MRALFCVLLAAAVVPAAGHGQVPPPGAGVPEELARARAERLRDLRYELALDIPREMSAPITGVMRMAFALAGADRPLVIDFVPGSGQVARVAANGRDTRVESVNGHLVVPAGALRAGPNIIEIAFTAGDAPLNRSAEFLYALFVPARARQAIPVFDQPDLKARWTLEITLPADWQVVANGRETSNEPVANGRRQVRFAETEPLPTYLFSFVAGDFQVESAERGGRTLRMFHRETDKEKVARNRDAIFDLHARALEYMERYTGIPYPFGKLDFVLIPSFQFGGMEHAGKILYNAAGLMLDESATQNQYLGRASVIAHETAHMWFGDLVTMRWFNDVWMKEVFANFMAAKIVNPSFPEVNHELRFLLSHYPAAYGVDRTPGANAIRQPLANLDDAGSLYGAIIYQKAPIVMRHLEGLMGEEEFRDGLREYLTTFAFGNATWSDLIAILDRRTPRDLAAWSRIWVEEPGRPLVETALEIRGDRVARLALRQRSEHPALQSANSLWPQQLRLALGYADGVRTLVVNLDRELVVVDEAEGLPAPLYVLPSGEGWGYGAFRLDSRSLQYLSEHLPDIADPLTRGAAWITLWDALLDGSLTAARFVDLARAALPRESDEQLTNRVLGYTREAWWKFLAADERRARQASLESLLRAGLDRAESTSQKAAWFNALENISLTPDTTAWMRRVWERTETIAGLPLSEQDYMTLALELAVREVDGWRDILATQHARIENPDRRARFEFVMPALSADPAERDRWFAALGDVKNRRREPWVLEGLSYLHHPLRAEASAKYVEPALEMLREIQRTGDIFFPTRWITATLSGHSSPEVAAIVRRFLDRLPADYPPRLRNTILVAADDLFRAARARAGAGPSPRG
jgi:aminopeptidase N